MPGCTLTDYKSEHVKPDELRLVARWGLRDEEKDINYTIL